MRKLTIFIMCMVFAFNVMAQESFVGVPYNPTPKQKIKDKEDQNKEKIKTIEKEIAKHEAEIIYLSDILNALKSK